VVWVGPGRWSQSPWTWSEPGSLKGASLDHPEHSGQDLEAAGRVECLPPTLTPRRGAGEGVQPEGASEKVSRKLPAYGTILHCFSCSFLPSSTFRFSLADTNAGKQVFSGIVTSAFGQKLTPVPRISKAAVQPTADIRRHTLGLPYEAVHNGRIFGRIVEVGMVSGSNPGVGGAL
jgi:hypothetical protein